MNPYCILDLRRPRHRRDNQGRNAFPVTRSGVGVDLPGVGRRDMSDQEDTPTAQAARGVRGDIPGSRSRDIGYEFVNFRRPDLSSRAMG